MINLQEVDKCITAERLKQDREAVNKVRWLVLTDEKGVPHMIDVKKQCCSCGKKSNHAVDLKKEGP